MQTDARTEKHCALNPETAPVLNPNDIVPLYVQLYTIIHDLIQSGALAPGERLPTEEELSAMFHVSRITVRKAISELMEEDLLARLHGKGTFVRKLKIQDNINENLNFTLSCQMNNVRPGSRVISMVMREATKRDRDELELPPRSQVLYLKRVRYADNEPVILEHNSFPEKYAFLKEEDLHDRSLYEVLCNHLEIRLGRIRRSIEICSSSSEEAKLLHIGMNTPIMLLREIVYDHLGKPIHRTKQMIVGEKFKITIE